MNILERFLVELGRRKPAGVRLADKPSWREEALCAALQQQRDADLKRLQEQISALTSKIDRHDAA